MTTDRLFAYLYITLFVSVFILLFSDSPAGWVLFVFLFIAIFGVAFVGKNPAPLGALAFGLVGLIVWGIGVGLGWRAAQMTHWPTTNGVITASWFCASTVNGKVRYNEPCIGYDYTVNGATYEGDSADTREFAGYGLWWRITGIPTQYHKDHKVMVYYDPANPGDSRLNPGLQWKEWVTVVVGAWLDALALVTLLTLRRARPTATPGVGA